jgi:hypothetical protein
MKAFNAKCFMENADMGFKEFLDRRRVTDFWLVESFDFKSDMIVKSNGRRRYGWNPSPENKRFLLSLFKKYLEQEFPYEDENGNERMKYGIDLINDVYLLDEIISYRPDNNVDRITAFMSCLGFEYYAFNNFLFPNINRNKPKNEEKIKPKTEKNLAQRMYGGSVGNRRIF